MTNDKDYILNFWRWFFIGSYGESPGVLNYCNKWTMLHIAIAILMANLVNLEPHVVSEK